jgi:hypothetical protein
MIFVGRENEASHIIKKLQQGNNVVLGGKFGIGRTSLIKKVSETMADKRKFIFIDFGQTPGKMSEKLMRELGLSRRFKKTGRKMGYKSMRYRIATVMLSTKNKPIIIFDNIAKITPQKIIFLRNIIEENHFQFIAIIENFLAAKDLFLLKAQLFPAETFSLHYLKDEEVISFIRLHSEKYHLNWSNDYIHSLAALTGGYPLGIIEMIKNKKKDGVKNDG